MASASSKQKLERIDRWQQDHRVAGVALATLKKFQEDHTTNLAGLVAFWAFFSIFPLLLVLVTVLGYVLPADLKAKVMAQVGNMLPVLHGNVGHLSGSWWALVLGIVTALWSGLSVVRTVEFAFNSIWEVPEKERPKLVEQTVRGVKVLGTIGLGLVLSVVLTTFVSGATKSIGLGPVSVVFGYVVAIALDVGLFVAAFRMLTDREITTKQVLPGAVLSGVIFFILQSLATLIIGRYTRNAQSTYGTFATVITMLWWFYLQAIVTLLGAQLNVVLTHRLWPRSLIGAPDTTADHRAYDAYAKERTFHDEQQVHAHFTGEAQPPKR